MKRVCKWSCVCFITAFMLLAVNPSAAEARRWRRVVRPVYVVPVRVYAPARRYVAPAYRRPVQVFAPGVRVRVGGYGGVGVSVGRWGW